ncbi:MAG: iron complex outermembrane receptor protein [Neolewinella sp.]|jgi:outer membrane receptor protein involved in Fe transport
MKKINRLPFVHTSIALGVMVGSGLVTLSTVANAQEVEVVANAQEVEESDGASYRLEEIIVTSRRRTQDIQDVPLYIQAYGEKDIREGMMRGFEDYARDLTSVSFGTSGPGASTIAFRGAISQPAGFDAISSSTLYLDEIPITRDGQNPDVRLYDIERLEALSGPQPTLYGAGSQSGTLKIVTNKPDTENNGGSVMVEAGYIEEGEPSYNVSGVANFVIVPDKLAVRLVGFHETEGGYIDNVLGTTSFYSDDNGDRTNADQVEDDVNDWTTQGARLMVRWEPNQNWIIDAGIIYQNSETEGRFDFNPALGDLKTIKFKDETNEDEWYNLSLSIQADLGFADLTIAGGTHNRSIDYNIDSTAYMSQYRTGSLDRVENATGVRAIPTDFYQCYYYDYNCFETGYNFGENPTGAIRLKQEVQSFAQEIRLVSKDDGSNKLNWLVGAFYEKTDNDYDYLSTVDDLATNNADNDAFAGYYGFEPTNDWFDQGFREGTTYNGRSGNERNGQLQDIEQFAVFGEVSYRFTDTLTATVGGRWFNIERGVEENSLYLNAVADDFSVTEETEDFSPRYNVTWTPTDDIMLYATYSEGVRPGGQNGTAAQNNLQDTINAPLTFAPDTLKNKEIGAKATWMDGRLITNMSLFMMDWEDYQLSVRIPEGVGVSTVNVGNASIDGVEGMMAFKISEKWELSSSATFLDAGIDDDVTFSEGLIVAAEAGDALPVVPEWKVAASLEYRTDLPFEGLTGMARFDYNYTGESVNSTQASVLLFAGSGPTAVDTQPAYDIGSLFFTVESEENGWSAWIGIDNLWDERAITFIAPRFGDGRAFTIRPREISVGFWQSF